MDLLREIHTPQRECGPSQKARKANMVILDSKYISLKGDPFNDNVRALFTLKGQKKREELSLGLHYLMYAHIRLSLSTLLTVMSRLS